jgi:trimethylamine--corrinoid protein Co-methyltransferase
VNTDSSNCAFPQIRYLSPDQIQTIHQATLQVMERTGVVFYEPEVVEILRKAGAHVSDDNRVRIPAHLVEEALRTAPSRIVISDRNGQPAMFLEGTNSYFGTGSDTPNVIDPYSGQRRPALKQDVAEAARICDYLPNIDFVMSMGLASDVNALTSDRHHFEAMRSNTTKPIIFTAWNLDGLKDIYDMCVAVAGSPEAFRKNASAILYAESTTPRFTLLRLSKNCSSGLKRVSPSSTWRGRCWGLQPQ